MGLAPLRHLEPDCRPRARPATVPAPTLPPSRAPARRSRSWTRTASGSRPVSAARSSSRRSSTTSRAPRARPPIHSWPPGRRRGLRARARRRLRARGLSRHGHRQCAHVRSSETVAIIDLIDDGTGKWLVEHGHGLLAPSKTEHALGSRLVIEAHTLTDGGQPALEVAERLAGFLGAARTSLDLALYDFDLLQPTAKIVADGDRGGGAARRRRPPRLQRRQREAAAALPPSPRQADA